LAVELYFLRPIKKRAPLSIISGAPPLASFSLCAASVHRAGLPKRLIPLFSGLGLAPGSDPEPASSFLRRLRLDDLVILLVARGGLRRGIGGGPVSHAKLRKLERLAGPSVPDSAPPYSWLHLTPRFSKCAERRSPARGAQSAAPPHRWWLSPDDRKWLEHRDRPQSKWKKKRPQHRRGLSQNRVLQVVFSGQFPSGRVQLRAC
jgi:hypothetical protein